MQIVKELPEGKIRIECNYCTCDMFVAEGQIAFFHQECRKQRRNGSLTKEFFETMKTKYGKL